MQHHHGGAPAALKQGSVVLVGSPNVGKSLLFKHLTGRYVTVSNYTGTTVEVTTGRLPDGRMLVDAPGVRSLFPASDDERVTLEILLSPEVTQAVLVMDAKNLERGLVLLAQLALLEIPTLVVLNMWDEARDRQIRIDVERLETLLGVPVIPTVALEGWGIRELRSRLTEARTPRWQPILPEEVEAALEEILASARFRGKPLVEHRGRKLLALLLVLHGGGLPGLEASDGLARPDLSSRVFEHLYQQAREIAGEVMESPPVVPPPRWAAFLDAWMTHPVAGFLFLGVVLWALYEFVGVFGAGTLVDFLEGRVFGEWINPWLIRLMDALPLPSLVRDFFVGEFGVFTMALTYGFAIIFPIVLTFFIAFGLLEDSGYLPRLAYLLDRFFRKIGLSGKAVLPMVLGLGCVTMATVTTRTLESRRERFLVTLLLALGVPCSAQLGVVMAMMAGLSPWAYLIWGGMVTLHLLFVGFLASRVIPGKRTPFIMEIPPLRRPSLSNIFLKTWARLEWYLTEVIPVFVLGTALLFVMDVTGLLAFLERLLAPITVHVLGLPPESARGFVMGFLRRDYGAAGFLMLKESGLLDFRQVIVSVVTITLFVPCIANFLVMLREQGKKALGMVAFIVPYAIFAGWFTRWMLTWMFG